MLTDARARNALEDISVDCDRNGSMEKGTAKAMPLRVVIY
jgi:hypothetical protein